MNGMSEPTVDAVEPGLPLARSRPPATRFAARRADAVRRHENRRRATDLTVTTGRPSGRPHHLTEFDRQRERLSVLSRDLEILSDSLTWRVSRAARAPWRSIPTIARLVARMLLSRSSRRPGLRLIGPPAHVADVNRQYSDRLAGERMAAAGPSLPALAPPGPLISILVPVYNTEAWLLWLMRQSVERQTYPNWEVCLANDASTEPHVGRFLASWQAAQPERVRYVTLERNTGISGATQAAFQLARGEYIALVDHDDEITADALLEVARVIRERPDADFIYSDEDKVDESGERYDPFFKPAWSPDLMLSMMYTGHLAVFRRPLVERASGFRPGYDGSQDYDLVLRITEVTENIYHVPKVLYHWRAMGGSAAAAPDAKQYAVDAAKRALEDALHRRGLDARIEPCGTPGRWRARYAIEGQPEVAILVPSISVPNLQRLLPSILGRTDYQHYRVVVLDNSLGSDVARYVEGLREARVVCVEARFKPFNYSLINNFGARSVDSPYLLLLNDDTEVITGEWLTAMLEHAQRRDVGAVGAKLLYPDGRIQHAGVVLGLGSESHRVAGHSHKYYPADHEGYFSFLDVIRNYSAVTGACMMTRRDRFLEIGGLNDRELAVAFNDVDYCLRLRRAGYRVVYTPFAVLNHYESASRGRALDTAEVDFMMRTWGPILLDDPYYNPNLSQAHEDFGLR